MNLYTCKVLDKNEDVKKVKIFAGEDFNFYEIFSNLGLTFISKNACKSSIREPLADFTIPFFRNLSQLIKNRLDLIEALKIVKTLFKNDEAQLIVETIINQIKSGNNLSKSLSEFKRYFDILTIKTIEVSEKTAELHASLVRIVNYLEHSYKLKRKIKESMRYPLIVLGFISFVFLFWLFVLVPRFAELFSEINIPLPLISRIIIKSSKFVLNHIWIVSSIFLTTVFCAWKLLSGKFLCKVPVVKNFRRDINTYNFFSAMEIMLQEKINLMEALECMSDIVPRIQEAISSIKVGHPLSFALLNLGIFSDYEIAIVKTGEQSGDLEAAFKSLSDLLKQNIEITSQRIISIMQPTALGFMGLLLVIIVYALISPLYSNLTFIE